MIKTWSGVPHPGSNRIAPPESPLQYLGYLGIDFLGENDECDPPYIDPPIYECDPPISPLWSLYLKKATITPFSQSRITTPVHQAMLQRRVSQENSVTSRALRNSGQISSTPVALPPNYITDLVLSDGQVVLPHPQTLLPLRKE